MIVFCHTRELAMRISREYERFSKYMANVKVSVFSGGLCIRNEEDVLKTLGKIKFNPKKKNLTIFL